ncbi:AraC family transcriptional regulator [Caviibacterium pharyngocola]|uniref:AraC family transcriptional regulator n=1 Tax=Caviibacterium pharyngocola TaxID=28159 RepID=A0A2M8RUC3_9PAST|nr:AraC family transcriptional regulator [Caviibacterium pharyngocola]PJG82493.1 AraC family transcriptional regulator [Caviibacterium pharyngocola]
MQNNDYLNFTNLNAHTDFPYLVLDEKMTVAVPEQICFHIMHWHDDFQFTYIEKGEIECVTLEQRYHLKAGDTVFINENILHQIVPTENACYKTFRFPRQLVSFYLGSPASREVNRIAGNEHLPLYAFTAQTAGHQAITALLQELIALENQPIPFYEYAVLSTLSRLWLALLQHTQSVQPTAEIPKNKPAQRMRQFLHYIERHYAEEISLDSLAQSAHVSKSECLRCFQNTMNTTPYQYLMEFRLAKAQQLLLESSLSVGDIAEQTGFNQQSYFGKCFRQKTGLSPSEYRQKYRKYCLPAMTLV